jgi:hypothetical protein
MRPSGASARGYHEGPSTVIEFEDSTPLGSLQLGEDFGILSRMSPRVIGSLCTLLALLLVAPALAGVVLKETPLGNAATYESVKAVTFSSDSRHLAFVGVKGDKQFVVRDGVESKPYDWVIPDSLSGPLDLSHLAFIIQNGNEMVTVVDGQAVGGGYYFVGADRITFSADGKHYAYTARRGSAADGKALVIHDGVEGKPYAAAAVVPTFSPDGTHLAYTAALGAGKTCVVLDDKEQAPFDNVVPGTILFSPDSKHLSYTAIAGSKVLAVVDGKTSKPYDQMRLTPIFSPDSSRVIYIAGADNQYFMVLDGVEGPKFEAFTDGSVVFSPDSHHLAYAARKGKQWELVLDGKEQSPYDAIAGESIHFSPDSAHLAYVGITDKQRVIVLDGKASDKHYDNILWPGPLFSPNSLRVVYAGARGERIVVVTDNVEGPIYDNVAELGFSPDSKRVVFRALNKNKALAVIDGKEFGPFDNTTSLVISPDSIHYAFVATEATKSTIMIDGQPVDKSYTGWVKGARPAFSGTSQVNFLMVRDLQFVQVRAEIGGLSSPAAKP